MPAVCPLECGTSFSTSQEGCTSEIRLLEIEGGRLPALTVLEANTESELHLAWVAALRTEHPPAAWIGRIKRWIIELGVIQQVGKHTLE